MRAEDMSAAWRRLVGDDALPCAALGCPLPAQEAAHAGDAGWPGAPERIGVVFCWWHTAVVRLHVPIHDEAEGDGRRDAYEEQVAEMERCLRTLRRIESEVCGHRALW
jgi:hypothetical protein